MIGIHSPEGLPSVDHWLVHMIERCNHCKAAIFFSEERKLWIEIGVSPGTSCHGPSLEEIIPDVAGWLKELV